MTENSEPPTAHSPTRSDWQASAIPNWRRWMLVGLLFFAALINYLDRATISVALPRISGDLPRIITVTDSKNNSFFMFFDSFLVIFPIDSPMQHAKPPAPLYHCKGGVQTVDVVRARITAVISTFAVLERILCPLVYFSVFCFK